MDKDMKAAENMSKDTSKEVQDKKMPKNDKIPTENPQDIKGNPDNISDPNISSGVC